jgi:hypothetical protein
MKRIFKLFAPTLYLSMAKVDGPLLSIEARGKIADAIVFFPWKGRHVVRQWLKPTNPKSTLQGYVRVAMKLIAKEIEKISCTRNGDTLNSKLYTLCTAKAPAGLNWNAFHAQGFLALCQSANTFLTASFAALVAEYSSLGTDVLTAFETNATALGLADLAFGYGYTTNCPAGLQLFLGAKAAYHNSLVASAPYNIDPVSWAASDVNNFKSDHTTA